MTGTSYAEYVLPHQPEPWTAPEASAGRSPTGRVYVREHKAAALTAFQNAIKETMAVDYPGTSCTDQPVALELYVWRQLTAYEGSSRKVRKHVADATNMQKAIEDALQGVLFDNDNQVVYVSTWVVEQADETEPLIVVGLTVNPEIPDGVRRLHSECLSKKASNEHSLPDDVF